MADRIVKVGVINYVDTEKKPRTGYAGQTVKVASGKHLERFDRINVLPGQPDTGTLLDESVSPADTHTAAQAEADAKATDEAEAQTKADADTAAEQDQTGKHAADDNG